MLLSRSTDTGGLGPRERIRVGAVWFPEHLTWEILLLVVLAAFLAGAVDAVVGGGGLVQLPALLLVPGVSPVQALAVNKLASVFGTGTSSVTYYRRVKPDLGTALPMAAIAFMGAFGGATIAALLPADVFKPIIVLALIAVAAFTAARPGLGSVTVLRFQGRAHHVLAGIAGLTIGFYDGILGPGTGSFLIIVMVAILGYDFLQASAKAKIVNFATNLGALMFFIPHGSVLWGLGLIMAAANMTGGYIGARLAIRRGSGFVRVTFLVVVTLLIARLGADVWIENVRPILGW